MDDPFRIQPEEDLPEGLRRDLHRAYAPETPLGVPAAMDDHIQALARARLAGKVAATSGRSRGLSWSRPADRRRIPMRLLTMASAAAALLMAVLVGPRLIRTPVPAPATTTLALHADIDNDGRVDIVDALVLSQRLRDGVAPQATWDIDDDGAVNERDAHAIRAMVVSLTGDAG